MTYSTLTINISNIIKNYKAIKEYVNNKATVAAVVKCNCYGLGLTQVTPEIFKAGCNEFYVATLNEGITLRNTLKSAHIYILNGIGKGEEKEFLKWQLTPVLNNTYQIQIWTSVAQNYDRKLPCIIQIDSGMTRVGIDNHLVKDALNSVISNQSLNIHYILSHLSCADNAQNDMNTRQLQIMKSLQNQFPNFKYSLSNSAGIFLGEDYLFNQVRPGHMLYGIHCGNSSVNSPLSLSQVVNLTSKIIDIHFIKDSSVQKTIGYDASYKLKPGMVTATIPVGYGDGYPRTLSNKGYCYINGTRADIIGEISMDLLCLDISNVPKKFQNIGQEVELIGDHLTVEEIANLANTRKSEILTSLGHRYKIKYKIETASADMY
ncbi:MAG: alanine racemase [Rickettsiales bacterium]|nr:alanine racemase [Rickettsiales bacterium]